MSSAHQSEATLLVVIIQLAVIISVARIAGNVGRRLGQPMVVGEIVAGLLLGPSFLGRVLPGVGHALFPPTGAMAISVLSQIGLILLMFLIGLEFDFSHVRTHGRTSVLVALTGIAVPFGFGMAAGHWIAPAFPQVNRIGFILFLATALSITAIPVLGRVMVEFNIHRTRLGALTIAAAAIDDALGWILLAIIAAIVGAHFDPMSSIRMLLLTVLFAAGMALVARPFLIRWSGKALESDGRLSLNALATLCVLIFICAIATNLIGIFSIFGPFILGANFYDQEVFRDAVFERLKDFVTAFFLPIFFTYTGLHTDMGSLETGIMWLFFAGVMAVAVFGKVAGCFIAARISGLGNRQAGCVGIMMNARGLMGLIAANVGLQMGAVPPPVYCMLVLMCVISTMMLSPILRRLITGTELAEPFSRSEFARAHSAIQRANA